MSELILKDDGTPFATEVAAKATRTRMGENGQDTNIIEVEGGFALERKPETRRKKRVPIGQRQRIYIDPKLKKPGYKHRVVNDAEGRLDMFEEAGYEFVRDPKIQIGDDRIENPSQMGSAVKTLVGKKPNGEPMFGYLMRIKKEWYDEDQQVKHEKIEDSMEAIKNQPKKEGQYGSIKIQDRK